MFIEDQSEDNLSFQVITWLLPIIYRTEWRMVNIHTSWARGPISPEHMPCLCPFLEYKACHIPVYYRCRIQKSNHIRPLFIEYFSVLCKSSWRPKSRYGNLAMVAMHDRRIWKSPGVVDSWWPFSRDKDCHWYSFRSNRRASEPLTKNLLHPERFLRTPLQLTKSRLLMHQIMFVFTES